VLVENLSVLLNTPRVYAYDRRGLTPSDFQVIIDVTRFDSAAKENAYLTTFWTVVGRDGSSNKTERKSVFAAGAPSADVQGVVAAQNSTLSQFSREIATAIQSLQR
jgi:uncharacterized lipoprotein YmbA